MTEVEQYLSNLDDNRKAMLETVRKLILKTVPDVQETMKYRMPTYELNGNVVCSLASQKNYVSLYMDTSLVKKYSAELKHLKPGKSCIRFRKIDSLPLDTVEKILKETVESQKNL